jgi:hypothetical protein
MALIINPIDGELCACRVKKVVDYIATPTATNLRDALIEAGIMKAEPVVPSSSATTGQVFQDDDGQVFQTDGDEVFSDT